MSAHKKTRGILYVVATPIGNLGDISARARKILSEVAIIAAEDTRHTGALLAHLGIEKAMVSLHEHNEAQRVEQLVKHLNAGDDVALVSDAGTPLISDPGFDLVRITQTHDIRAIPIPGPCAAIAALSVAGLPTDRFAFEGFLPSKSAQRRERLMAIQNDPRTLIFYEAPHRLANTLSDLAAIFGERRIVVARELTKQFESLYFGTAEELAERAQRDDDMNRGEVVILAAGAPEQSRSTLDADEVLRVLLAELPPTQAAKLAARLTDVSRDELYRRAVELTGKNS